MQKSLVSIFLLSAISATGQVAIIQDQDGYTNIRKSPDAQSEIVHRIYENEVFWFNKEEKTEGWVPVHMPKNEFSFGDSDWDCLDGFIHQSRLIPLNKLEPYNGESFYFQYIIEPFDSTNRIIGRVDGFVESIDGRDAWGIDGSFPKKQVTEMKVKIDGNEIEIHPVFYRDIFECRNKFAVYKNGNTWFVHQLNSDGAGAYELVWVFSQGTLKQRLVGRGIH